MNIKGNLKYVIIGSVVFLIIYMFVAAVPIGPDISFSPVWTRDITAAGIPEAKAATTAESPDTARAEAFKESGLEAFILGNRWGYFTPDGRILSCGETAERASASIDSWTVYPQQARNTKVFRPDGSLKMTVAASGYVHIDAERTFLFLPEGDAVSQYGDDGVVLWTREGTAPITAFNSSPAGTVIGYADGRLTCVRADGSDAFSFYPGGSNYQIILGAAISEDGSLAACVSGIDRQRFLLISIKDGQYKIVYHAWLEGNLREQAFVDFEKNGNYAFFQTEGGLGIADCKRHAVHFVPVDGRIQAVGECPGDSLFVALSGSHGNYTISAIERPNHLIAKNSFRADNAFLIQRETAVYLGIDTRISRIEIRGIK